MNPAQSHKAPESLQTGLSSLELCIFYSLACAAMLFPTLYWKYPLSGDYLNHLSRVYIIFHADDPFFSKVFHIELALVPNLALDLIAFVVRPLQLDPYVFMKGIYITSTIGMWIGVLECHRAIHGRIQPSILLALPVVYSFVVAFTLIDFAYGMGIFFFVFAWIIRAQPQLFLSLAVVNCVGALVLLSHLGAFLIMGISLFLYRIGHGRTLLQAAAVSVAENVIPLVLYFS